MFKNIFCCIALLAISSNANAWIKIEEIQDNKLFFSNLGGDEVHVCTHRKDDDFDPSLSYNERLVYHVLNIAVLKQDIATNFEWILGRYYSDASSCQSTISTASLISKTRISNNLIFLVLEFIDGYLGIYHLDYDNNKISEIYASRMHRGLTLTALFTNGAMCRVFDQNKREVFTLNSLTKENNILVPGSRRFGCSIM